MSADLGLAWSGLCGLGGQLGRWGLPPGVTDWRQAPCDGFCDSDHLPWWRWRAGGQGCCKGGSPRDDAPLPFPLQIKIIKRLSLESTEQDLVQVYQYKIQERNVTFFARGLSAAVL